MQLKPWTGSTLKSEMISKNTEEEAHHHCSASDRQRVAIDLDGSVQRRYGCGQGDVAGWYMKHRGVAEDTTARRLPKNVCDHRRTAADARKSSVACGIVSITRRTTYCTSLLERRVLIVASLNDYPCVVKTRSAVAGCQCKHRWIKWYFTT